MKAKLVNLGCKLLAIALVVGSSVGAYWGGWLLFRWAFRFF